MLAKFNTFVKNYSIHQSTQSFLIPYDWCPFVRNQEALPEKSEPNAMNRHILEIIFILNEHVFVILSKICESTNDDHFFPPIML